ncbi:LOW QUALITY PROTEIN: tRNA methyltransferase 10 homolog C [Perca fluviatilis]|uniref:LOW QUALITY PROTEIN: tRNA methyltransferase 10 homolog C n=1 Tax=Perca fluviatilis TaxID=8168 RepID=UPI001965D702|nr:LOW QUALITY PROTEIN: tRNA methyltransferase 10 homolog C [Perca fluviatilis]
MLRLFTNQGFYELCKCSHFVASCVSKRQVIKSSQVGVLPVCSAGHHRLTLHIPARLVNTGTPVWNDAFQPKREKSEAMHTLDLDKWKSVMRAQAASEEKQQVNDEEEASDEDENLKDPGGDLKDSSSLEATRDLVAMWRQAGKLVPQEMTEEEVQTLAGLTTKSSRKKYLKYLAIKEGHKRARKEKQQQRKAEREASMETRRGRDSDAEDDRGPELKNTLFLQFWGRTLDKLLAWRSAQAMLFDQPLVFDMSYESNMARRELENTVSQLMEVEGWNRRATEPYHLHFCNLKADGAYQSELLKRYGAEAWDRLLITTSDQQHVDLFPREQLVYLTADSPNVLRRYDHSKVYIIGALVDRSIQSGLSLANAKRLNLATARLPLDEFLHWGIGAKNLTLDQMLRIMLTFKETGKWEEALKFVPKRKYDGFHQQRTQKAITKKVRGVTNPGPSQDGERLLRSGERNGERTFKNPGQSLYRSHKESGFSSRDRMAALPRDRENKPAATRVRTSFKSNMEGRKGPGKGKMWWGDE